MSLGEVVNGKGERLECPIRARRFSIILVLNRQHMASTVSVWYETGDFWREQADAVNPYLQKQGQLGDGRATGMRGLMTCEKCAGAHNV